MSKLINSISIQHYRGFEEKQELFLSENNHVTFLVGSNNSGKSIIARALSIFQNEWSQANDAIPLNSFDDKEFFDFNTDIPIEISFSLNKDNALLLDCLEDIHDEKGNSIKGTISSFDEINFILRVIKNFKTYYCHAFLSDGVYESHNLTTNGFKTIFYSSRHGISEQTLRILISKIFNVLKSNLLVFDSIRSFDRDGGSSFFITGSNLLEWLQEGKNQGSIRKAKGKVSDWLSELNLDVPRAVRVDEDQKQLLFTFENHLELSSSEVGTGYTMLYILLTEIARKNAGLVVIDEIESHLQPGLVRILMGIIKNYGEAQYIIATHSPTVMEAARENDLLYRFKKEGGRCTLQGFFKSNSKDIESARIHQEVRNELGVVPGDALLTNSVIWVEGPSEIYWLRAWLKNYYPIYKSHKGLSENIIEGLHYSILMSGGSLIRYLSYNDVSNDEQMLSVLRVNPNPFVIIDSDNAKKGKRERMLRIANELVDNARSTPALNSQIMEHYGETKSIEDITEIHLPNFWILNGRELENYTHPQILKDFCLDKESRSRGAIAINADAAYTWDVFSSEHGAGKLLDDAGVKGIKGKGETIEDKIGLAQYVADHLKPYHFFEQDSELLSNPQNKGFDKIDLPDEGILWPTKGMVADLRDGLTKILDFIVEINDIK